MTGSAVRRAEPDDTAALNQFLAANAATSMFLRSNLARHGTQDSTSPQGTTFYLAGRRAAITAVFGLSNHGFVMAQAPGAPAEAWADFARQITGRRVAGMTGVPDQVQNGLAALGLLAGPWQIIADEPMYHLDIARLVCDPVTVRAARADDLPLLEAWFGAYEADVGQAQEGAPWSSACKARAARAIDSPDVVLLEDQGVPVAMAGINARLPDMVQIGGVFTPDGMRGRGYARRALAGLLRQCQAQGVTQSVLFANNDAAARAYEALGYQLIGQYRVALLRSPCKIGDPS
jgi:predicted GNAT family acetyltransferase